MSSPITATRTTLASRPKQPARASLLGLPLELRDKIFSHLTLTTEIVLCPANEGANQASSPEYPHTVRYVDDTHGDGPSSTRLDDMDPGEAYVVPSCTFYRIARCSVLLVCRQICTEYLDHVRRNSQFIINIHPLLHRARTLSIVERALKSFDQRLVRALHAVPYVQVAVRFHFGHRARGMALHASALEGLCRNLALTLRHFKGMTRLSLLFLVSSARMNTSRTYDVVTASTIFDKCPAFTRLPTLNSVACVQEVVEKICVLQDPKRYKITSFYGPETDGFQFKLRTESMVSRL